MRFIIILAIIAIPILSANAQGDRAAQSSNDTIMLREVVVKASKPATRISGDGIVTTINGTVLSSLGSAVDVLGFIPGVSNIGGNIEVIGKGSPAIYINGRLLRNKLELQHLKSDKIKDITLINNPGAKYDSSTNAVIKISTVKNYGEGFSLDSKTSLGFRNYVFGKEQLGLNYRTGGLDIIGLLDYNYAKTKGSNSTEQNAWLAHKASTLIDIDAKGKAQTLSGQFGFNYSPEAKHSFGAYYRHTYKPSESDNVNTSSLLWDDVLQDNDHLLQRNTTDYYEHLIDGYYSGILGNWTIDFTFDYLWRDNKTNQSIIFEEISFDENSKSRMFAGKLHLSRPLWNGTINLGAEYTDSKRDDIFTNADALTPDCYNQIKERNTACYAEFARNFNKLSLQFGLRYEHINSQYFELENSVSEQSKKYDKFLPSATLSYAIKNTMIQLGYSRKYIRPHYSQLSSAIFYVNQYLYECGNPFLRTPTFDNVSLNIKYKWLLMSAQYQHTTDKIITSCTSYGDNSDITLFKKDNSPTDSRNLQIILTAMPGFIGKFYYPVLTAGIIKPFYEIEYMGKAKKMNKPMYLVQFNNIVRLPNNYSLTATLSYRSSCDSENVSLGKTWQFNITASKTIDKHWDLKLTANDIFNTAKNTSFTMYSGVREVTTEKTMTSRYIELAVGYKFNVPKSRYKGKGAGETEKARLE